MKGGVGKSTLTFNLAWYSAWKANLRVLIAKNGRKRPLSAVESDLSGAGQSDRYNVTAQ